MVIDAVRIADGADMLDADLHLPKAARGLVIFAHGSGSSRFSTRNRQVAESLNEGRFATLLLDLLTPAEERVDVRTAEYRFDIALLARRVMAATDWASGHQTWWVNCRIGYFGASTGAAAALIAAAERPAASAVVSRGGRPDLAGDALPMVRTPTLLIVGGDDGPVIELNRRGDATDARTGGARHRAARHAPLRGARRTGGGAAAGARLVQPPHGTLTGIRVRYQVSAWTITRHLWIGAMRGVCSPHVLPRYADRDDVIVLALPRGGVPVAYEVASALGAPMDVFLVRKLGTPGHRELAMGAIASGGVRVLNDDVVRWYGIPEAAIERVAREEATGAAAARACLS